MGVRSAPTRRWPARIHGLRRRQRRRGSFFGTLQLELFDRQRWATRDDLAAAIFEWIECFYNPQRRHSFTDMLDYETTHAA
ncbi:MAG: IS3 family transposase [Actinomycetota bacterium]|nr:IS3 family transposase [Actinomycetota bacterium]